MPMSRRWRSQLPIVVFRIGSYVITNASGAATRLNFQRDFNVAYVRLKVHCVAERTTCLIIIFRDTALGSLNSDALRI